MALESQKEETTVVSTSATPRVIKKTTQIVSPSAPRRATETEEVVVTNAEPEQIVKTTTTSPVVKTDHPQKIYDKKIVIFRTYQIIWYILGVIEILLTFRIVLKALGAYSLSGFTSFIYAVSDPLALPFMGILPMSTNTNSVFEWSSLIAIVVYAVIAFGLVYLLQLIKPVTPGEVEESVDNP